MPDRSRADLPLFARALLWIGERTVPEAQRIEWLRRWRMPAGDWWAVLVERRDIRPEAYGGLFAHCRAAISDAFWLRISRDDLRSFAHSPQFLLLCFVLLWAAIAAGSGGFSRLRRVYGPLPYTQASQLVFVTQTDAGGRQRGIPLSQIRFWQRDAKAISAIGGYANYWRRTWVTPNLTEVVGVRPQMGREFRPDDPYTAALVTNHFWRGYLNSNPGAVDRGFETDGQKFNVLGVLPRFTPGLPEIGIWTAYLPGSDAPALTTIARLKPGVSMQSAATELELLAHKQRAWMVGRVTVSPLTAGSPLPPYFAGIGFGVLIGVILVIVTKRSPVVGHVSSRQWLLSWTFLLVKTGLALGGLGVLWVEGIEVLDRFVAPSELRSVFTLLFVTFGLGFASALAVLWAFLDQRRRCPVCLYRLTMPVRIGSWSSPLLEPVTTEFVCERGHGSLSMPETQSSTAEGGHWTGMDESWRDLFSKK